MFPVRTIGDGADAPLLPWHLFFCRVDLKPGLLRSFLREREDDLRIDLTKIIGRATTSAVDSTAILTCPRLTKAPSMAFQNIRTFWSTRSSISGSATPGMVTSSSSNVCGRTVPKSLWKRMAWRTARRTSFVVFLSRTCEEWVSPSVTILARSPTMSMATTLSISISELALVVAAVVLALRWCPTDGVSLSNLVRTSAD